MSVSVEENKEDKFDIELERLMIDMIGDDKKSIDIARILITKIMASKDEYTDLTEKQVIHLTVLKSIALKLKSKFLLDLVNNFVVYRKSIKRQDRKEAVKMIQSLKEDNENMQSKLKNLLGIGN